MSYSTYTAIMETDDIVCENCRHWDETQEKEIYLLSPIGHRKKHVVRPCGLDAVDPDAGQGAIVLLGPDSHCRDQVICCFEPLPEVLSDILYNHDTPDYIRNGVTPGIDFPATLAPARRMAS